MVLGIFLTPAVDRYGARQVSAVSGVVLACGLLGSAFSFHVITLFITYGLLAGNNFDLSLLHHFYYVLIILFVVFITSSAYYIIIMSLNELIINITSPINSRTIS